jgi:hypothetical protein
LRIRWVGFILKEKYCPRMRVEVVRSNQADHPNPLRRYWGSVLLGQGPAAWRSSTAGGAWPAVAGFGGRARRGRRSKARPTRTEEWRGEASSGRGRLLQGGAGEGGARPAVDTIMRLRSSGEAVWWGELGPSQVRAGAASSGPSPGGCGCWPSSSAAEDGWR